MGLFGHTRKGIPSVLYYSVQPEIQTMTGIDRLLLKVLYDPRLRLGMSPAAARPDVRIVIDELLAGAHFTQTENQPVIPGGAPPIIAGSTPSGLIRGVTIRTNGRPALSRRRWHRRDLRGERWAVGSQNRSPGFVHGDALFGSQRLSGFIGFDR